MEKCCREERGKSDVGKHSDEMGKQGEEKNAPGRREESRRQEKTVLKGEKKAKNFPAEISRKEKRRDILLGEGKIQQCCSFSLLNEEDKSTPLYSFLSLKVED